MGVKSLMSRLGLLPDIVIHHCQYLATQVLWLCERDRTGSVRKLVARLRIADEVSVTGPERIGSKKMEPYIESQRRLASAVCCFQINLLGTINADPVDCV